VTFYCDGNQVSSPFNTATVANGWHNFSATAWDAANHSTSSANNSVYVNNVAADNPPSVTLTAPTSGSTVSGTITMGATYSDDHGVTSVLTYCDGVQVPNPFNTAQSGNGWHNFSARAWDTAGQSTTSANNNVYVNNAVADNPPSVTLTAPTSGSTVSGTITMGATYSDDHGVTSVLVYCDGIQVSNPFNTATVGNGWHNFSAKAWDTAGQSTMSANNNVYVNNGSVDNPPYNVVLTAPANGSTVSGTITLSASASDDVGVTAYTFYCDGNQVSSPFNTATVANGWHNFSATAWDAANHSTSSGNNSVYVNNVTSVPGEFQWVKHIGSKSSNTQRPNIRGVKADHQGNVLVVGDFNGTMDFGAGDVASFSQDIFLAKYSAAGALLWFQHFAGGNNSAGQSVAVDSTDNVIVAGYFSSTINFGGGPLTSVGGSDTFVAKFSSSGGHIWSKRFGGSGSSTLAYCVAVDLNNNVLMSGRFFTPWI
jgi:hypothetical protein